MKHYTLVLLLTVVGMNYDSYIKYEVVDYFRMKNTNLLHDYLKKIRIRNEVVIVHKTIVTKTVWY